jgi:hypothetical protein
MPIIDRFEVVNRNLDSHLDRCIPAILHLWDSCELATATLNTVTPTITLGYEAADALRRETVAIAHPSGGDHELMSLIRASKSRVGLHWSGDDRCHRVESPAHTWSGKLFIRVPIIMHDYITGGFTSNTSLAIYCRDHGLLLHIHRAMHAVIDRQIACWRLTSSTR